MKYEDFLNDNKLMIYSNTYYINILKLISNINEYHSRIYKTARLLKKKKIITNDYYLLSHQIKIFRKQTLKIIENKFSEELNILRKNKFRDNNSINYHFLVMNYEQYIHKNIKIELNIFNSIMINGDILFNLYYYLTNKNKSFIKKKFVCFNNITSKNKEKFNEIMSMLKLQ